MARKLQTIKEWQLEYPKQSCFFFWNCIFWMYKAFVSTAQVSLYGKLCNRNMIKAGSTAGLLQQILLVGIVSTQ